MKGKRIGRLRAVVLVVVLHALLLPYIATAASAAATSDDYLHAVGSTLYDDAGNEVRLTGIAWFGFETGNQVYHGLWTANMEDILDTVANQGFNVLRIPLSVQLVNQWRNGNGASPASVNYSANPDLQGLTSLQILDASIAYCKKIGLKVMLDMHRVVNTQMLDSWYTADYPAADFEACWKWLAEHYKNDDTVIAMDLFNEPHGQPGDGNMVKWDGSTDANNWRYEAEKVANIVLDVNPGLLVVIEGVEATPKAGYTYAETNSANYDFNWWGGNLRGVKDYPVNLGNREAQVVYSPHDYGPGVYVQPWFASGFTQDSLRADCWYPNWLYISTQNIAPILIGEWGGKMDGGDNQKWMGFLASEIVQQKLNHTFWCVNPNSGDTGGILLDDWKTVDTAKYELIEKTLWHDGSGHFVGLDHQVDLGSNGTHVGAAGTPAEGVAVTGVGLTPAQLSVDSGATAQLTALVSPSDATNAAVTWQSSDTTVATVSTSGEVTGVGAGTATITVTTADGGFSAAATVTVTASGTGGETATPCANPVAATLPLVIDGEGEYCKVSSGEISNINSWNMEKIEINGVDYTNVWSNSMPAKIGGNYYIHYVGNYPWSHLEVNGSGGSSAGNSDGGATTIAVSSVTINPANTTIDVGGTGQLTATVLPANATDDAVTWQSSDTGVATVNSSGEVMGVGQGTATITVTSVDGGFSAGATVTVSGTSTTTGGSTTATSCTNSAAVPLPLVIDGEGEYCKASSGTISYINSWNMDKVEINGVDYTNVWSNTMPAKIDGNYYIHYVGSYPWSHLEVNGSGGSSSGSTEGGNSDGGTTSTVTNYTVNIATSGNGSTMPLAGAYTYASGSEVSVTATPAHGATFVGWSGAATGTANPVTISVGENTTLTAAFSGGDATLPEACSGECKAATPVYPEILGDGGRGNVTMYSTAASQGGACNYGTTSVKYYAAMSVDVLPGDAQAQWQGGKICGQCAEVTALTSEGPKSVVVRIMDKCPDAYCGIDLGGSAPGAIMLDGAGRYEGKWRFVSCDGHPEVSDGAPTLDVLSGSNAWWSRVHVRNAPAATDSIEWQDANGSAHGFFPFATDPENSFEVPVDEVLQSGISSLLITVHYLDGTSATVTLSPSQLASQLTSYPLN